MEAPPVIYITVQVELCCTGIFLRLHMWSEIKDKNEEGWWREEGDNAVSWPPSQAGLFLFLSSNTNREFLLHIWSRHRAATTTVDGVILNSYLLSLSGFFPFVLPHRAEMLR